MLGEGPAPANILSAIYMVRSDLAHTGRLNRRLPVGYALTACASVAGDVDACG